MGTLHLIAIIYGTMFAMQLLIIILLLVRKNAHYSISEIEIPKNKNKNKNKKESIIDIEKIKYPINISDVDSSTITPEEETLKTPSSVEKLRKLKNNQK